MSFDKSANSIKATECSCH